MHICLYIYVYTHEIHDLSRICLDSSLCTLNLLQINFLNKHKTYCDEIPLGSCSAEVASLSGGASSFGSVGIPFRSVGSSGTQKDETKLVFFLASWEILNEYAKRKMWNPSAREILSRRYWNSLLSRCQTSSVFGLLPSGFTTGSTRGSHAEAPKSGEQEVSWKCLTLWFAFWQHKLILFQYEQIKKQSTEGLTRWCATKARTMFANDVMLITLCNISCWNQMVSCTWRPKPSKKGLFDLTEISKD